MTNGAIGALKGGVFGLVCAGVASKYWPAYRHLTRQFKVFVQVGFIIFGGCYRVDRALIAYEQEVRIQQLAEQKAKLDSAAERGEIRDITGRKV